MRKEIVPHSLPDGSINYGNGVIGPSLTDQEYFNDPQPQRKRRPRRNLAPYLLPAIPVLAAVPACIREADASEQPEIKNFLENGLVFPLTKPGRYTGGPHPDDPSPDAPKDLVAVDFAAEKVFACNNEERIKEWPITASAKGKVVVVGNEKDPTDPNHSIVKVKHPIFKNKGVLVKYMHLRGVQIRVGGDVDIDTVLGFAGCGAPPRKGKPERVTSPHLHISFEIYEQDSNGKITKTTPIPIKKVRFAGYQVNEGNGPHQGTLTKEGEEERVANADECPPERRCDGKRNDIDPQRARLVFSPSPLPRGGDVPSQGAAPKPPSKAEVVSKVQQVELELLESSDFEFKYPKGWIKDYAQGVTSFIDPQSPKDNPTRLGVSASGRTTASIEDYKREQEKQKEEWLKGINYQGSIPKAKLLAPIDGKPALMISVERHPGTRGSPEYDTQEVHILAGSGTIVFMLITDPSVTNNIKPLFETVARTFKERPPQAAKPAEAQKPSFQIESPKTMTLEQRAKSETLAYILNLLKNTQVLPNQQRLDSQLLTPIDAFPFSAILQDQGIRPDTDLVRVRWVFAGPGFRGTTKVFGQGEIKNFQLKTANILPVTPADRANGIQWKGSTEMAFINRYRAVKPWFFTDYGAFKSGGRDSEWAKATIPEPTIPFTPWTDGKLTIPLLLRNGRWEVQQEGAIAYPILPALYMNDEGGCRPDGRSPIPGCEVVRLKWEEN